MRGTAGPLGSVLALLAGEAVNKFARFLAAVVLARTLSLSDFGAVNVGIAAAGFALMATNLGLPDVGSRDVAVRPSEAASIAGRVLAGRIAALALVALIAGAAALLAGAGSPELVLVTSAMALGLALSADWLLRGSQRMQAVAAASATGGIVVLLGALTVVSVNPSPLVALGVFAAAEFVVSGVTWAATGVRRLARPSGRELATAIRRSWPVGLAAFIVYSYYANLDTLILSIARSSAEAGLYSAPYRTFLALNVVGTFAAYAYLPLLAKGVAAGRDEDESATRRLRAGLPVLCGYGILTLGVAEIVGGNLLGAVFGPEFEGVESSFILLCIAIPWYSIAFPIGYCLIARDANRRFLRGAAVAGALNLLLNLALIPPLGIDGAAIATAAALVGGSVIWIYQHREVRDDAVGKLLTLIVGVTAAAVIAVAAPASAAVVGSVTAAVGLALLATRIRAIRG